MAGSCISPAAGRGAELGQDSSSIPWFHQLPWFVPGAAAGCDWGLMSPGPLLYLGTFLRGCYKVNGPLCPLCRRFCCPPGTRDLRYFLWNVFPRMSQIPGLFCGKFYGGYCYKVNGPLSEKCYFLSKSLGDAKGYLTSEMGPVWYEIPIF